MVIKVDNVVFIILAANDVLIRVLIIVFKSCILSAILNKFFLGLKYQIKQHQTVRFELCKLVIKSKLVKHGKKPVNNAFEFLASGIYYPIKNKAVLL